MAGNNVKISVFADIASAFNKMKTMGAEINKIANTLGVTKSQITSLSETINSSGKTLQVTAKKGLETITSTINDSGDVIAQTTKVAKANISSAIQEAITRFTALYTTVKKIGTIIWSWAEEAINFNETENLFEVSMGSAIDKAEEFQTSISESFGTAIEEMKQYQATFKNILSSSGDLSIENTEGLSETLTQLGLDYASLYNVSEESAMSKLKSALTGSVMPIRSESGYDITVATLKEKATELGVSKDVSNLNQMEKKLLRIIVLMEQMRNTNAMGDLARTIESPSNQLKVLQNQLKNLKIWLGNVFISTIGKILPYINGFIMALVQIAKLISTIKGNTLSYTATDNLLETDTSSIEDGTSSVVDNLDDANESAKELKRTLQGFDVLNVIETQSDTSSASSSGTSSGGGYSIDPAILEGLESYDSVFDSIRMKATDIRDKILEWLGFVLEFDEAGNLIGMHLKEGLTNAEKILEIMKAIGIAIAAWKISSTLGSIISTLTGTSKANAMQFAAGLTLTITGFYLLYNGTKHLLEGDVNLFTILETIGGGVSSTVGIASMLKSSFLGKKISWGTALTIGISITLAVQGYQILKEGINTGDISKKIAGALELALSAIPIVLKIKSLNLGIFSKLNTLLGSLGTVGKHTATVTASLATSIGKVTLGIAGAAGLIYSIKNATTSMSEFAKGNQTTSETLVNLGTSTLSAAASGAVLGSVIPGIGTAFGATAGAAISLGSGLISYAVSANKATESTGDMSLITKQATQAYEDFQEEFDEFVQSYKDSIQTIEDSYDDKMADIALTEEYKNKLNQLIDSNGNVTGSTQQVQYYLDQLNNQFGTNYEVVDRHIEQNGEIVSSLEDLNTAIDENIEQLKLQAKQEVLTEKYKEQYKHAIEAKEKIVELQQELQEAQKINDEYVQQFGKNNTETVKRISEISNELGQLATEVDEAETEMANYDTEMAELYSGNTDTIASESKERVDTITQTNETMSQSIEDFCNKSVEEITEMSTNNQEEFSTMYNKLTTSQKKTLLSMKTTTTNYSGKIQEAWRNMAQNSASDYLTALSQTTTDTQNVLLQDISTISEQSPEFIEKLKTMAETGVDEYGNELSTTQQETLANMLEAAGEINSAQVLRNVIKNAQEVASKTASSLTDETTTKKSASDNMKAYNNGIIGFIETIKTSARRVKNEGILGVLDSLDLYSKGSSLMQSLANGINSKSSVISRATSSISGILSGITSKLKIFGGSAYATGGLPDTGELFIAREAGPELVGRIGNQTAVANNDQIVQAVSQGVASAVSAVLGNSSGGSSYKFYIDGKQITDVVQKRMQRNSNIIGN